MAKRTMAVIIFALCAALVMVAADGTEYGKKLTLKKTTSISDILASPGLYNGKRVLVEGKITSVCEMMGCWIMIQDATSEKEIQFKVEDGVIEFPTEENGKWVTAEGIVEAKTLSVDEQIEQGKHHAEEMGTEFDPKSIKGPKTSIRLLGEGAVIK